MIIHFMAKEGFRDYLMGKEDKIENQSHISHFAS